MELDAEGRQLAVAHGHHDAAAVRGGLETGGQVVARYTSGNPNGSARDIAGVTNPAGNVVGLMPHPEHAIDPLTGPSADGLGFFTSAVAAFAGTGAGAHQ